MIDLRKKIIFSIIASVTIISFSNVANAESIDYRQYAHGISFVENPAANENYLVWSDAFKKGVAKDGSWTHDVYRMKINMDDPKIKKVKRIIKAREAQEPASSSCTDDGNMIVTFEDGNDAGEYELCQRFVIYDKRMHKVKKYPATVAMGGHSGHAASTSDHHIVFWCDGWIDGGGVDDLGTGDDLYVTSMDSDGENEKTIPVAESEKTRDWWPVLSASDSEALLVWQRYLDNEEVSSLCMAMYNPADNKLKTMSVNEKVKYYMYNVVYLKNLQLFAVNAVAENNKGILLLIDNKGNIVRRIDDLEPFVREASPAVEILANGVNLYYPADKSDVQKISISTGLSIKSSVHKIDYTWADCGTAGFVDNNKKVWFAALNVKNFKKHKKTISLVPMN